MLQDEIIDFFQNVLPFNRLSREALGDMVSDIAMEYYPKGEQILKRDGPPSEFLDVLTGCFFLPIFVYFRYKIFIYFLLTSCPGQFSIHSIEAGRFSSTEFFYAGIISKNF